MDQTLAMKRLTLGAPITAIVDRIVEASSYHARESKSCTCNCTRDLKRYTGGSTKEGDEGA